MTWKSATPDESDEPLYARYDGMRARAERRGMTPVMGTPANWGRPGRVDKGDIIDVARVDAYDDLATAVTETLWDERIADERASAICNFNGCRAWVCRRDATRQRCFAHFGK